MSPYGSAGYGLNIDKGTTYDLGNSYSIAVANEQTVPAGAAPHRDDSDAAWRRQKPSIRKVLGRLTFRLLHDSVAPR